MNPLLPVDESIALSTELLGLCYKASKNVLNNLSNLKIKKINTKLITNLAADLGPVLAVLLVVLLAFCGCNKTTKSILSRLNTKCMFTASIVAS